MMRLAEATTLSMSKRGFFERLYEVHSAGDLRATLSFESAFGGTATGLFGGDSWTFRRTGFFGNRVTIRKATSELDDAVYQGNRWSRGGTLTFRDGRRFTAASGKWESGLSLLAEAGEAVMSFRPRGFFNSTVEIEVVKSAPDLPLLLLFGCYLVALMLEETASAGAVVATMG
jgi:hypothetical protein